MSSEVRLGVIDGPMLNRFSDLFTGSAMRVMMMAHPGTNSRDILLDVEAGFRHAGHDVIRWEFEPMLRVIARGGQGPGREVLLADMGEMMRSMVAANQIDFTIAMWSNGLAAFGVGPGPNGMAPMSFFERSRIRHVLFWLDAPHWKKPGTMESLYRSPVVAEPSLSHVINNPGLAYEMREVLGFGRVLSRRYGVNPEMFKPWPGIKAKHDIVFNLGPGDPGPTELMTRELDSDDPDLDAVRREASVEARRRMGTAASEAALGIAVDGLLDAWIASQMDNPGVPVLDRLAVALREDPGLEPSLEALKQKPKVFVQISGHARSIERWRRAFTITYLSRHFDCAVFGTDGLSGWPHNAKQFGGVPYRELSKMYGMGRIALNAMRWQDDEGLNLKPFEITASGTPCLCDYRGGLEDMFELGEEIAAFRSPGEARRTASELLATPERLISMARAGRARTLRDHTWARWADDVCEFVAGAGEA